MQIPRDLIIIVFQILTFAIVIRAVLSWLALRPDNPLVAILDRITEPILAPLRRLIPRTGMIDITPLIVIILLQVIVVLLSGI